VNPPQVHTCQTGRKVGPGTLEVSGYTHAGFGLLEVGREEGFKIEIEGPKNE
jgi:hypothetical protein